MSIKHQYRYDQYINQKNKAIYDAVNNIDKYVKLEGVLTYLPNIDAVHQEQYNPVFNYIEAGTRLQLQLRYANADEENNNSARIFDLICENMNSGGISSSVTYSRTLRNLLGNLCEVKLNISDYTVLTLQMRVISMNLYEGDDTCFPHMCGKIH